MLKLSLIASLAGLAAASCQDGCSGHGRCGDDDVCECYQDWQMGDEDGGDCSDRTCPFEIAWVDRPQSSGHTHRYAECSNRGLCDRSAGVCECFDGYTGSACQRTTCPNDCSGHGTCEYLADLPFGEVSGDFGTLWNTTEANSTIVRHGKAHFGNYGGQDAVTFKDIGIPVWDQGKSRMCVCDAKWTDLDCSRRMCPKGNDVLDTRPDSDTAGFNFYYSSNTNTYNYYSPVDYQVQTIVLTSGGKLGDGLSDTTRVHEESNFRLINQAGAASIDVNTLAMSSGIISGSSQARTFALTFTTNLNETYTTAPIELKSGVAGCQTVPTPSGASAATCAATDDAGFIANALLALPNKVIDGVSVSTSVSSGGAQYSYTIAVTFVGESTQGQQNLLEVEEFVCGDGCTPKRSGLVLVSPDTDNRLHPYNNAIEPSYVFESQAADWNVYECGRRGKCDYDSGLCECFEGFYGEACGYQSALV